MCPHCAMLAFLGAIPVVGSIVLWWRMRRTKLKHQQHTGEIHD